MHTPAPSTIRNKVSHIQVFLSLAEADVSSFSHPRTLRVLVLNWGILIKFRMGNLAWHVGGNHVLISYPFYCINKVSFINVIKIS